MTETEKEMLLSRETMFTYVPRMSSTMVPLRGALRTVSKHWIEYAQDPADADDEQR